MSSGRLLAILGSAVGGLASAAIIPISLAHADACDLGECALVSGGPPTDVTYGGLRPYFTQWQGTQPVDVEVAKDGSSFVSGTYNVSEDDIKTPTFDDSMYQYGNFTPAASNPAGVDSDNLSGVKIYDSTYYPGTAQEVNNISVYYPDGTYYDLSREANGQINIYESIASQGASADYVVPPGQDTPEIVWNALYHATPLTVADVTDVLPPDALTTWP